MLQFRQHEFLKNKINGSKLSKERGVWGRYFLFIITGAVCLIVLGSTFLSRARVNSEIANMSASFEWTRSRREDLEVDADWALPVSLHTTFACDLQLEENP